MMHEPAGSHDVAVVGLGSMGGAMAGTLRRAGWTVVGYDPTPAARSAAERDGIRCVEDPAQLTGIGQVVLSLPSAAVVATMVPTLLARPGPRVIVDTTTSDPATSQAMAALAETRAAVFVDAPVSGGRNGAATGALSAFVGGAPDDVALAAPLLMSLTGGKYRVVGPAGAGNVVKLLNNALCATNLVAVAEALEIASAHGVAPRLAAEAISGASGASAVSAGPFPDWILSGRFDSGFGLGLMARDVDLALSIGAGHGITPHVLRAVSWSWQDALEQLGPDADFTRAAVVAASATRELNPTTEGRHP